MPQRHRGTENSFLKGQSRLAAPPGLWQSHRCRVVSMISGYGSERGPVALPVFKIGRCLLAGQAGFDSQALPPISPWLDWLQRLTIRDTAARLGLRLALAFSALAGTSEPRNLGTPEPVFHAATERRAPRMARRRSSRTRGASSTTSRKYRASASSSAGMIAPRSLASTAYRGRAAA
jgi:hypothetical protein